MLISSIIISIGNHNFSIFFNQSQCMLADFVIGLTPFLWFPAGRTMKSSTYQLEIVWRVMAGQAVPRKGEEYRHLGFLFYICSSFWLL